METKQATITLRLEPENTAQEVPRPKTVQQLLNRLGLRPTSCLVIRDEASGQRSLLTPDLHLYNGDTITVRKVTSSG